AQEEALNMQYYSRLFHRRMGWMVTWVALMLYSRFREKLSPFITSARLLLSKIPVTFRFRSTFPFILNSTPYQFSRSASTSANGLLLKVILPSFHAVTWRRSNELSFNILWLLLSSRAICKGFKINLSSSCATLTFPSVNATVTCPFLELILKAVPKAVVRTSCVCTTNGRSLSGLTSK